ncbi:MAG: hypothetical protein AAF542_20520 [Pseudomonadota bacterium]
MSAVYSAPMKTIRRLILLVLLAACTPIQSDELLPFLSDGCSAFPDGSLQEKKAWLRCCVAHDYDYWKGGTYIERLESDSALELCVSGSGEPEVAVLMLLGVRVGGSPFFPTTFRWGYGWDDVRFYAELNEQDQASVASHGAAKELIDLEWERLSELEEWYE